MPNQNLILNLIYNPIDLSYYKPNIQIIKNSFIYMSDPNRGLEILLDCLILFIICYVLLFSII